MNNNLDVIGNLYFVDLSEMEGHPCETIIQRHEFKALYLISGVQVYGKVLEGDLTGYYESNQKFQDKADFRKYLCSQGPDAAYFPIRRFDRDANAWQPFFDSIIEN